MIVVELNEMMLTIPHSHIWLFICKSTHFSLKKFFSRNFICFCVIFIYNLTSHFWIFKINESFGIRILRRMFVWGLLNCSYWRFLGSEQLDKFYGTLLLFERLLEFLASWCGLTLVLSKWMRLSSIESHRVWNVL